MGSGPSNIGGRLRANRPATEPTPPLIEHLVHLPEVLSLRDNYEETVRAIREVRQVGKAGRLQVSIQFTAVRVVEPAAALLLAAALHRIRGLHGRDLVTGTYPTRRSVYDQLQQMGFYNLLDVAEYWGTGEPTDPSKPLFLKFSSGKRVEAEFVDGFVNIIEENLISLNEVARLRLVGAIIEAMSNTIDHSIGDPSRRSLGGRWWLCASINLSSREVVIILTDQGVGVPNTLDINTYDRIRAFGKSLLHAQLSIKPTDGAMIAAATEIFRSGTGQPGRGKGFRNMKQFVDICDDGELRVLSNRGQYTYMPGSDTYSDERLSIEGTLIEWRFRQIGIVDMLDE